MRWGVVALLLVVAGCGGGKSARPPPGQLVSAIVHADPVDFTDGSALPGAAIERRTLTCGGQSVELPESGLLTVAQFRAAFPAAGVQRCTSTVTVAGVTSRASNALAINCVQSLCFRVPGG
jgi:hypothetical protein